MPATDFPTFKREKNSKGKPGPADTEIESVRVERADNGFTVHTHRRVKKSLIHKFETMGYMEPERSVFESTDAMLEHIGKVFG